MVRFNHFSSDKIIPVIVEGTAVKSLPPLLRMKTAVDFTETTYARNMCRLIRDIHGISPRDKTFVGFVNEMLQKKAN